MGTNEYAAMKARVTEAMAVIAQGGMVILLDDWDRENEGDLVASAASITPAQVNFMAQHGRGLICMPMTSEAFDRLGLPMMTQHNRSHHQTAFGVSIGAAEGITTGISAADRAKTIQIAADPSSGPQNLVMPGHVFPLKAHSGGLFARNGHTEGSVALMRLAGQRPAAVICEIMNPDGTMARTAAIAKFAKAHQLPRVSIADIQHYLVAETPLLEPAEQVRLPIEGLGEFELLSFHSADGLPCDHVAIRKAPPESPSTSGDNAPLVRLHSECLTGDVFGSMRCDCGAQLSESLRMLNEAGGVLLYLRQEGRGIGLFNKIKAYALQDQGLDTVQANQALGFNADERDYAMAASMLRALGVSTCQLITNNPSKIEALASYGITVAQRIAIESSPNEENAHYLRTKRDKLAHHLTAPKEET